MVRRMSSGRAVSMDSMESTGANGFNGRADGASEEDGAIDVEAMVVGMDQGELKGL